MWRLSKTDRPIVDVRPKQDATKPLPQAFFNVTHLPFLSRKTSSNNQIDYIHIYQKWRKQHTSKIEYDPLASYTAQFELREIPDSVLMFFFTSSFQLKSNLIIHSMAIYKLHESTHTLHGEQWVKKKIKRKIMRNYCIYSAWQRVKGPKSFRLNESEHQFANFGMEKN